MDKYEFLFLNRGKMSTIFTAREEFTVNLNRWIVFDELKVYIRREVIAQRNQFCNIHKVTQCTHPCQVQRDGLLLGVGELDTL
jgi:hypothetical protein